MAGIQRVGRWVLGVLGCLGWVALGAGGDGEKVVPVSAPQKSTSMVATPMPFTNAVPNATWRVGMYAFEYGWSPAIG